MKENISLSIFGTFGNPNGFTQTIAGEVKSIKKYDLNPTAIQLFESTKELYAVRKEMVGKDTIISFIKYSYASEQGSSRGGTFVGASVINTNGIANISDIVKVLDNLLDNLISNPKNIKDRVIMVKSSNDFSVDVPGTSFLKVEANSITEIDASEKKRNLLVYTSLSNIQQTFIRSLELLNNYDTIYFTDDEPVVIFVQKKGFYELVQEVGEVKQLSEVIKSFESDKIKIQKELADKLLKELDTLEKDKESFSKNQEEIIDKNKEIHKKNAEKIEESVRNLTSSKSSYDKQIVALKELYNKLNTNTLKISERKQFENEFVKVKSFFNDEKKSFSRPSQLSSIQDRKITDNLSNNITDNWENIYPIRSSKARKNSEGFSQKEIFVILGAILLLAVGGFFVWNFFFKTENQIITVSTENVVNNEETKVGDSLNHIKLIPEPTGNLSELETEKTIERQFLENKLPMPIDTVVSRLYKANPTDIGKPYTNNKKEYGEYLIQKNPGNFNDKKEMTKTDHLQIPIYQEKIVQELKPSSPIPIDKDQETDKRNKSQTNDKITDKPITIDNLK
ncbi:hypothetical protein [Chryseobacterium sp. T1]